MAKRGTAGAPEERRIACVALTRAGLRHARRVRATLPERVTVYASLRVTTGGEAEDADDVERFDHLSEALQRLWETHDGLVLFFALGAAVRLIAPLLRDKRTDPAVVVVDDGARFAISVVSGHVGGANALAASCAAALSALPVITTASDVQGTLAVDLLGRAFGWRIESASRVTAFAAALANGEQVAIIQEVGERDWLPVGQPLPWNVTLPPDDTTLSAAAYAGVAYITDRATDRVIGRLPDGLPWVIYRPRSLVVGMGCRRGVPVERLDELLHATLAAHDLTPLSMGVIATADIKGDEPGLLALAKRHDVPLVTYPASALASVAAPTPSERVQSLVGTPSVSEAAALLASEGGSLVAVKRKGEGCTVALARRIWRPAAPASDAGSVQAARDYTALGGAR